MNAGSERLGHLDWLRALAIGLVVFKHSADALAPGGSVGVSVFYVLSGYLIASILMREGMLGSGNIGRFIVRRVARIYPLYVLHIAALVAGLWAIHSRHLDEALAALPGLLTFSQPVDGLPGLGFAVLWSLAVEFWFYVSFPLLLLAARATRRPHVVLALAACASLASKFGSVETPVLLYYDHFLIGAFAYSLGTRPKTAALRGSRGAALAGIAIIVASAIVPYPGHWNAAWWAQSLAAASGAGLFLFATVPGTFESRLPAVAFIGRISYSIYLVHALVLDVPLRLASNMPVYLALVVVISTGTYFVVEQPVIRFVHRKVRFNLAAPAPLPVGTAST